MSDSRDSAAGSRELVVGHAGMVSLSSEASRPTLATTGIAGNLQPEEGLSTETKLEIMEEEAYKMTLPEGLTVILLSGKQGSGKSTTAALLVQKLQASGHLAGTAKFAGVLYSLHDHIRDTMRGLGITRPEKDGKLLQILGTEWGRDTIDRNVWVRALEGVLQDHRGYVVIDDCRFPNELFALPRAQTLSVRLECPSHIRKERCGAWRDTDTHSSETALDGMVRRFDAVIHTDLQNSEQTVGIILDMLNSKLSNEYEGQ